MTRIVSGSFVLFGHFTQIGDNANLDHATSAFNLRILDAVVPADQLEFNNGATRAYARGTPYIFLWLPFNPFASCKLSRDGHGRVVL